MSMFLEVEHLQPDELFQRCGGFDDPIDRELARSYENFVVSCEAEPLGFMSAKMSGDDPDDEGEGYAMICWWQVNEEAKYLGDMVAALAKWLWYNWHVPTELWSHRDDEQRKSFLRASGFRLFRASNDPTLKCCPWRFRYSGESSLAETE